MEILKDPRTLCFKEYKSNIFSKPTSTDAFLPDLSCFLHLQLEPLYASYRQTRGVHQISHLFKKEDNILEKLRIKRTLHTLFLNNNMINFMRSKQLVAMTVWVLWTWWITTWKVSPNTFTLICLFCGFIIFF